jgi:hypothetical protein
MHSGLWSDWRRIFPKSLINGNLYWSECRHNYPNAVAKSANMQIAGVIILLTGLSYVRIKGGNSFKGLAQAFNEVT